MQKILIVEDHVLVRRSLREWLESTLYYEVLEADDGETGVDLALREAPCLVLMDIHLPGISGLEATRQIKAARPAIPIVVLSIHEDQAYSADALASGASAYVSKATMQARLLPTLARFLPPAGGTGGGAQRTVCP